jgi:uncharacterized protein YjdB
MSVAKKVGMSVVFSLLFLVLLTSVRQEKAFASGVTLPEFHFEIGGKEYGHLSTIELKNDNDTINVAADGWATPVSVDWVSISPGVVTLEPGTVATSRQMLRKGPGYTTITAYITSGSYQKTLTCVVWVDLQVDKSQTPLKQITTTGNEVLELKNVGAKKTIKLKYVDYTSGSTTVSGGAISSGIMFSSSNNSVATVNETSGEVTAVGSGTAVITIKSTTMSGNDKPLSKTLTVVVSPKFTINFNSVSGGVISRPSAISPDSTDPINIVEDVPSRFTIISEAKLAEYLKWEVYDLSKNPRVKLGADSTKLKYTVSDLSGNVEFENVKAGTYEIYAIAHEDYKLNTAVDKAYMKIVVPIRVNDLSITMQVKDTYNIFANSNIPSTDTFQYKTSDPNIVSVDPKGKLTAGRRGIATITCTYNKSLDLFTFPIPDFEITVRVIDGISLSMTNAIINTKGTLQLIAEVTDTTVPIVWSSSDTGYATVKDGLVTGVKKGKVRITAQQTIDGIVKEAYCDITVQQSVDTITIDPLEKTLAIGAFVTLHAEIKPDDLSGIKLQWKSSDIKVVEVVESSDLTATIKALSGGHAVISAINQDNVVVGYCHVSVQQPVTGITLSETNITIDLKTSRLQLRATVAPDNALNKTIVWSSTDASVAAVDQNGLVSIKKAGKVSIIATSQDSPAITAVCNIMVNIPVTSIALDETSKTMYVGQSQRLSYVLLPTNASNNSVTWISTNPSVATVDKTGLVVAKGVGTTAIILKTLENGQSVYCNITVRQVASGIKLDAATLNLKAGESHIFKPTLTPKNSTDSVIVWESSDTKVATVDDEGKVVAKAAGSAIIMARLDTGAVAYCKVNVTLPVNGLILNFTDKTIYIGEKFKLKVSVNPSTATDLGVTWKSSNTSIATVNEDGEITGIAGGTAVITCTTKDGGYSATCVLNVVESVSTITLNHQTYYLGVDKTVYLVATVSSPNASNKDVYWSTSNSDIATVNQKGKVTGKKLGNVTITATALDGTEVEATCEIQVVNPVESVSLSKTSISLLVGQTKKLKATVAPKGATIKSPKWTSSDPSVAIVDEDGEVIAIKAGATTITAEAGDSSGKKALCYVTVYDRVASTGITLQDKSIVMLPGEEKIVQMVMIPSASTDDTTWSSDNNAIAKVDKNTGKITARSTGVAYITVMTDSGKTAQVEVIVIGLNVTEITLQEYTRFDTPLQVEGATGKVTWSSSNQLVAEVRNGNVISKGKGEATITAYVSGRKLTCKIKVVKI